MSTTTAHTASRPPFTAPAMRAGLPYNPDGALLTAAGTAVRFTARNYGDGGVIIRIGEVVDHVAEGRRVQIGHVLVKSLGVLYDVHALRLFSAA